MKSTILLLSIILLVVGCATTKHSDFEKRFDDSIFSYTSIIGEMMEIANRTQGDMTEEEQTRLISQYECVIESRMSKHYDFILNNLNEYNNHLGSNETKEAIMEQRDERLIEHESQKKALEGKVIKCEIPAK